MTRGRHFILQGSFFDFSSESQIKIEELYRSSVVSLTYMQIACKLRQTTIAGFSNKLIEIFWGNGDITAIFSLAENGHPGE